MKNDHHNAGTPNIPDQLRFEMLLSGVTARFLEMDPGVLDQEIDAIWSEARALGVHATHRQE